MGMMTTSMKEEQRRRTCDECGYRLEGEELDYTVCRSCWESEMTEITSDWGK